MKNLLVFITIGILVMMMCIYLLAQGETAEDILFWEIPIVVTAAKKEQPITKAPATVTVITAEDIKQSGATNIPDILRIVPGVDVMSITVRDQQVSIRGFNYPMTNKLLVLIDGRSIYWDAYGMIFWDLIPVSLEEIDRIEIVKSPISSLYGANAYCGVINIITKSPSMIKGTEFNLTGGDYGTLLTSILHSGLEEKIDYKVSTEWDRTNEWRNKDERAGEIIRGNALIEYNLGEGNKLSLSGGRAHFKDRKIFTFETLGSGELTGNFDYLQLDYDNSNFKLQTFWKREDIDIKFLRTGEKQKWITDTYNTELQHSLSIGEKHSLILGANYRHNTIEPNRFIPEHYNQNLWALFLEDEIKVMDKLTLTLGGRYDWHPLVKEHFSPRVALSYSPVKNRIIRLSAVKAFQNPTYLDSYLDIEEQMTTTLPLPMPQIDVPYTYISRGNEKLKSEMITSYEIGYQSVWSKKIIANINLFYNKHTNFITWPMFITYYEENELFPGSPGGVIPKEILDTYDNKGNAWGIGGEIALDVLINEWLTGIINYSYQQITDKEDDITTNLVNEKDRVRADPPKNKANAGLRMKFRNGISVNLLAHWVDKTKRFIYDTEGNEYLSELRDYTILNVRVGYQFPNEKLKYLYLSLISLMINTMNIHQE